MTAILIDPNVYGIFPNTGKDMCAAFRKMFQDASETIGQKRIELAPGIYDFYAENAEQDVYFISNTVAESEMKVPTRTVPLRLSNVQDLEILGEGAELLMHGLVTNFIISHCKNITLTGVAFDHIRPSVTEMTVVEKHGHTAVFRVADDCTYEFRLGKPVLTGSNFEVKTTNNIKLQWANVRLAADNPDMILRWQHPFFNARKYQDLGNNLIKVFYWFAPFVKLGDRYALHDTTRKEVGIFIDRSNNITLKNVKEYYNHSHAVVAQVTTDVSILGCHFAPRKGSLRFTSSQTDYLHFSVCGGKITVKDSVFSGAFDDVFNVHGFHLKVTKAEVDTLHVKFMHPQAYGFLPFEEGDKIEFIKSDTLTPTGITAVVQNAKMVDKYTVELILDTRLDSDVKSGMMVENITKCADVEFSGCDMQNITTRGLLITTRGKVLIENNRFYKTGMSGILISDDAKSWYESGCVRDVTIRGNEFVCCGEQALYVYPEYKMFERPVHQNITFENNKIKVNGTRAINIRGAENVSICGNSIEGKPGKLGYITETECKNVKIEQNELEY